MRTRFVTPGGTSSVACFSTDRRLAGRSLGVVSPVCRLARELAPSLVVLEDVDLVAEERTRAWLAQQTFVDK